MSTTTISLISAILLASLIWMDTCLYFHIQCINENDQDQTIDQYLYAETLYRNHSEKQLRQLSKHENKTGHQQASKMKAPIEFINKFSFAFQGMSVKLMMTDPVDNYLLAPLSEAFIGLLNLKDNFWFVTPNLVSYAGVGSALMAAKLVSYDSSTLHKLSFVMFQLRTWLDDLDGALARVRLGIHRHVSLQKTPGYVIDGVCDAIGFVAYIIGCYIFMKNNLRRRRRSGPADRYNLQSITEIKSTKNPSTYIPLQQDFDESDGDSLTRQTFQPDSDTGFNSPINYGDYYDEQEEAQFRLADEMTYRHDSTFKHDSTNLLITNQTDQRKSSENSSQNDHDRTNIGKQRPAITKIYLEKIQNGKHSSFIFYRYMKEKLNISNLNNRKLVLVTLCFLLQIAICATFWNRYILVYRDLLESPSMDQAQARMKAKILKSNIMYMIIWFWRLTNGHSLMQMLIASVFVGKMWQFLNFIKYIGFVEIIILAIITELHIIDIRSYLN